jgi:RNA-binding protein NOB1
LIVVAFAKRTGDYAVLSQTDLSVIALTCQYELEVNGDKNVRGQPGERKGPPQVQNPPKGKGKGKAKAKKEEVEQAAAPVDNTEAPETNESTPTDNGAKSEANEEKSEDRIDEVTKAVEGVQLDSSPTPTPANPNPIYESTPLDDEDSDGGEWINSSNVAKHRSKDLGLVPTGSGSSQSPLAAACMTGDYAVQNVLLSMGLGLIGEEGKRINKVKSWVLRCHACFK